jgi:hypothetical protein
MKTPPKKRGKSSLVVKIVPFVKGKAPQRVCNGTMSPANRSASFSIPQRAVAHIPFMEMLLAFCSFQAQAVMGERS